MQDRAIGWVCTKNIIWNLKFKTWRWRFLTEQICPTKLMILKTNSCRLFLLYLRITLCHSILPCCLYSLKTAARKFWVWVKKYDNGGLVFNLWAVDVKMSKKTSTVLIRVLRQMLWYCSIFINVYIWYVRAVRIWWWSILELLKFYLIMKNMCTVCVDRIWSIMVSTFFGTLYVCRFDLFAKTWRW